MSDAGDQAAPVESIWAGEFELRGLLEEDGQSTGEIRRAFLEWFGGRRDLYARQWFDERRRRGGYRPIRQPLTEGVVEKHLAGSETVGQYLLGPDQSCHFAVVDLDVDASTMAELRASHGDDVNALRLDPLRTYVLRLRDAASSLGVPIFVEETGNRGVHLWTFFRPRVPAATARVVLGQIIAAAGTEPTCVSIELFPKQTRLGPAGLSSLVKLPLGVHQVTGRRCHLMDSELKPILDAQEALARLRAIPADLVASLQGRQLVSLPAPEGVPRERAPALPTHAIPRTLAERLRAIDEASDVHRANERVLSSCGVLDGIVARAHSSHRLTPDEARGLVYTLGLIGSTNATVEDALLAAGASLKQLDTARSGLPNPAGCKRLSQTVTALDHCVKCRMPKSVQPYRTPVLFAVGEVAPGAPQHESFSEYLSIDTPAVTGAEAHVSEALQRIETRLEAMESRLGRKKNDAES